MKSHIPIHLLPVLLTPTLTLTSLCPDARADQLRVVLESAPAPNGPWNREDLGKRARDANGNPLLPMNANRMFFRSVLERSGDFDPSAPIDIGSLPPEIVERAKTWLDSGRDGDEGWGPEAEIAPEIMPIYDLAFEGGRTPAFLEFKITREAGAPAPGAFPNHPDDCLMEDLGYILLPMHEGEHPAPQSATRGLTIVEQLQCRARTTQLKSFSWGASFFTAEDLNGRTVASFGERPFKVDPSLAETLRTDRIWRGDSNTGEDIRPEGLPPSTAGGYESIDDFKSDYLTNPIYRKKRERHAARARLEWNVERGELPSPVTLREGESISLFPGRPVAEFQWDDEAETPRVTVSRGETGGITVHALATGDGMLIVVLDGVPHAIPVQVTGGNVPREAPRDFKPGWQPWITTMLPGGYDDTPRYTQLYDDNWCDAVGCGPNALAMLTAWYDRHGVPGAFGNRMVSEAPPNTNTAGNRATLIPELDIMHDLCDVICNPFSDAGATLPGDECDGILEYTQGARDTGHLKMSWDIEVPGFYYQIPSGAGKSRTAIKKGRPSIVGIGFYWHYVLAYGSRVRGFQINAGGPAMSYQRQLLCNMGWGPGASPQWLSYYDIFFNANVGMWKGPHSP